MSRGSVIAFFALVLFLLASPSANAKQRTDPDASSPAGVIYEIPFDTARKDAAPKKSGRDGAGDSAAAGSQGTSGSAGTGTSGSTSSADGQGGSGDDQSGGGGSGGGKGGSGSGSDGQSGGSSDDDPNVGTSIHSENGFGSSSRVPGVDGAPVPEDGPPTSALRTASAGGEPSSVVTFGLVVLVLLVGGWIGVAASRHLRS